MKIRPIVWTSAFLMFSLAFCIYQVSMRQSVAQPAQAGTILTQEQREERHRKRAEYRMTWEWERDNNYRAKENNGSKRSSLTLEQLPAEVRGEAQKIAQEYREGIYPTLQQIIKRDGVLPSGPATLSIPELRRYIKDAYYKGTGPEHLGMGSWSIGIKQRLDGTMISRPIYANEPADAPHDVWAENTKFLSLPKEEGFLISGWDDGRVTFDPISSLFYGGRSNKLGNVAGHAVPGQAGTPPAAAKGLNEWMKRQDFTAGSKLQDEQSKPE